MSAAVIRNADWVISWDETAGHHAYRRDVYIAFADDRVTFVGRNYAGPADRVIDGGNRLVLPGLIDYCPGSSASIRTPSTSRSIAACAKSTGCATCT